MGNLKVVAVFLFTVFLGLFVFQNFQKTEDAKRDIAQEDTIKETKDVPQAQVQVTEEKKPNKMKDFKARTFTRSRHEI